MIQLTDDQRRRFAEDGFLILDRFVEPGQVARVVERFEPLFRGQFETGLYPDEWNWREGRDPAPWSNFRSDGSRTEALGFYFDAFFTRAGFRFARKRS